MFVPNANIVFNQNGDKPYFLSTSTAIEFFGAQNAGEKDFAAFQKRRTYDMIVYYIIVIGANIASAAIFFQHINLTVLSLVPLLLSLLAAFQAKYFSTEKVENGFRTNYGSNLSAEEENEMFLYGARFLSATIPWMIPFIFFFPSAIKLLSILIYVLGLLGGLLIYRYKKRK